MVLRLGLTQRVVNVQRVVYLEIHGKLWRLWRWFMNPGQNSVDIGMGGMVHNPHLYVLIYPGEFSVWIGMGRIVARSHAYRIWFVQCCLNHSMCRGRNYSQSCLALRICGPDVSFDTLGSNMAANKWIDIIKHKHLSCFISSGYRMITSLQLTAQVSLFLSLFFWFAQK